MAAEPDTALRAAIAEVLAAHSDRIAAWRRDEPGAWGFLAGQAVLARRRQLGRGLTDVERRQAWAAIWAAIEATQQR